jgi:hypothetical protein
VKGSLVNSTNTANEWQRIWLSIQQHGWTAIALVPSSPGIDVLKVAESLASTGSLQGEQHVSVTNATGLQLETVQPVIDSIAASVAQGKWILVPVDPIHENPSAIAVVRATSAALLLVRLGESLLTTAQETIDALGRERFLGSIVLNPSSDPHFRNP